MQEEKSRPSHVTYLSVSGYWVTSGKKALIVLNFYAYNIRHVHTYTS